MSVVVEQVESNWRSIGSILAQLISRINRNSDVRTTLIRMPILENYLYLFLKVVLMMDT